MTALLRTARITLLMGVTAIALDRDAFGGDRADKQPFQPLERIGQVEGHVPGGDHSPFDRDGAAFITKTTDVVHVWDARTLNPITKPLEHGGVKIWLLSGDGKTVLTGGTSIKLWDVGTSAIRSSTPLDGLLRDADVSPNGSRFVTVGDAEPNAASVWRAGERQPALTLKHRDGRVEWPRFDPTGRWIVTHLHGEWYNVYDAETGRVVNSVKSDNDYATWTVAFPPRWDPRGGQLAVPLKYRFVIIDSGERGRTITVNPKGGALMTEELRFSTAGGRISVVGQKHGNQYQVDIFDADTGKFLRTFGEGVRFCQLLGDGRLAICDGVRNEPTDAAGLWDVQAGVELQSIAGRFRAASPDGRLLLFDTPDGQTTAWRIRDDANDAVIRPRD